MEVEDDEEKEFVQRKETRWKALARDPRRFGRGAIEGVAAPESANNAAAQTSFIPMLTLGLPTNPVMAVILGTGMGSGLILGDRLHRGPHGNAGEIGHTRWGPLMRAGNDKSQLARQIA